MASSTSDHLKGAVLSAVLVLSVVLTVVAGQRVQSGGMKNE